MPVEFVEWRPAPLSSPVQKSFRFEDNKSIRLVRYFVKSSQSFASSIPCPPLRSPPLLFSQMGSDSAPDFLPTSTPWVPTACLCVSACTLFLPLSPSSRLLLLSYPAFSPLCLSLHWKKQNRNSQSLSDSTQSKVHTRHQNQQYAEADIVQSWQLDSLSTEERKYSNEVFDPFLIFLNITCTRYEVEIFPQR